MITPGLEKLILSGKATFKIFNHALSSFGTIPIPQNNIVIITHIKWYPFINPFTPGDKIYNYSWKQLFSFNEYQLKIDAKKSLNHLVFRNPQNFILSNLSKINNFDDLIDSNTFNQIIWEQAPPINTDVFIICEEFVKLSITRNSFNNTIKTTFNILNDKANEKLPPSGLKNVPLLLNASMSSMFGNNFEYIPGGYINANQNGPNQSQSYTHYQQPYNFDDSIINDFSANQNYNIYRQYPLIEFGIVTISSDEFNKLQNS